MKLSEKSQDFLENLRLYLFSSGKKSEDIDEVIDELTDHLWEAEKAGKNVDNIIGRSHEHYMKNISVEMNNDYKGWIKWMPIILLGIISYVLLGDAIQGTIEYSLYQIIGFPLASLFLLGIYLTAFKYTAKTQLSKRKEFTLFFGVAVITISLFLVILFLNQIFGTTIIQINSIEGEVMVGIVATLIFISIAIWSKSWITIITPFLLFVPEFLVEFLPIQDELKLVLPIIITFVCFLILFPFFLYFQKSRS